MSSSFFFFQAEDGIRDLVRSRGLGDVYKRQGRYRDALRRFIKGDPGLTGEMAQMIKGSPHMYLELSLIHI